MNTLSNTIYHYYLDHYLELTPDKQFHFASRLHLWSQDSAVQQHLGAARTVFTANGQPQLALTSLNETALSSLSHGSKNAAHLREPYFKAYPDLKRAVMLLFRVLFLATIYDIDAKTELASLISPADCEQIAHDLLNDPAAIGILSTHAVNFLYLYSRFMSPTSHLFQPQYFLEVGRTQYDRQHPIHIQLLIYLYTHCIIGESLFYYRHLPTTYIAVYETMFNELTSLIESQYERINLDNKFEYLTCAQLLHQTSPLAERILAEAAESLSPNGNFIIDQHNQNPQVTNSDLNSSEHRNVLLLLATRPYTPLA